jgi:broad specificity phosphatase PhoE
LWDFRSASRPPSYVEKASIGVKGMELTPCSVCSSPALGRGLSGCKGIRDMSHHIYFITHPDVVIDPSIPVPRWPLSGRGCSRMRCLLGQAWIPEIAAIYCSTEQKAVDGAAILSKATGLPFHQVAALGENDRSATGYLPKAEFEATVDAFFARPHESIRGWERAVAAQTRIVGTLERLACTAPGCGPIVAVSHGGVGALLLCHLKRSPITRREEQPGSSGGHYFLFQAPEGTLIHGWTPIDA